MRNFLKTWREAFAILNKRPKVMVPFVLLGILNVGLVYLFYCSPQKPVYNLLGPPIQRFFGEKFLHYPYNFALLPKLCNIGELFLGALVGMFITAVAVGMIAEARRGERVTFFIHCVRGIKRYFSLLIVWGLMFGLVTLTSKLLSKILPPSSGILTIIFISIHFFMALLVNLLFIYAVPLMIIGQNGLFKALKENIITLKKMFPSTLLLVSMPALLYLPIVILRAKTGYLITTFFPEVVLGVLITGAIISVLVEMMVTTSITVNFLNNKE